MFSDRTNWKLTRNRLTEALEEVRAGGARVLDLTISNPTRAGLRYGIASACLGGGQGIALLLENPDAA